MNAKIRALMIGIMLTIVFLSACTAKTPEPIPATATQESQDVDVPAGSLDTMLTLDEQDPAQIEIQNKAAEAVRKVLAEQLKVEASSLELVAVEPIDWPDACLAEPQEGEMCAQAITPGFRITFSSEGQNYTYHTDLAAGVIRLETKVTQVS